MKRELQKSTKITLNEKNAIKLTCRNEFDSFLIIDSDCSMIVSKKPVSELDRFPAVGAAILELPKLHFYRIFYEAIKKHFTTRVHLAMMDTDSYFMSIESENLNEELKSIRLDEKPLFDISNHDKSHPDYSEEYKGVLGMINCELAGETAIELLALSQKIYAVKMLSGNEKKKSKGVPERSMKKIQFEKYKEVLYKKQIQKVKFKSLRSYRQQLYQIVQNKIALTALCTCRYFFPPYGVKSLPFGHVRLKKKSTLTVCNIDQCN